MAPGWTAGRAVERQTRQCALAAVQQPDVGAQAGHDAPTVWREAGIEKLPEPRVEPFGATIPVDQFERPARHGGACGNDRPGP